MPFQNEPPDGAGSSNGDGLPHPPNAYRQAWSLALTHLHQYAAAGIQEASYLIDRDTGEVVDFVEAAVDEVTTVEHNERHLVGRVNIVNLHAHLDDLPPGAEDWLQIVAHKHLQEVHAVGDKTLYSLLKPLDWVAQAHRQSAYLFFQAELRLVQGQRGYRARNFLQLPLQAQRAILNDTNEGMAQRYGILYRREVLR